ncbi:putative baseplate assembly protein [Actinoplanes sp. CA-051413]|uniref:putative baseplate assembly protein n=1 Tax=Actinoplanes sp. CA-051413 TaxID=3239899 RepID=UPI003D97EB57
MIEKLCGCCAGTQTVTPADTTNPPGRAALSRRVGTQARFLESMLARISAHDALGLTTRDTDDFAIALLDGWAMVADVLTFYQERVANEGYLRTATEPESLAELGRLLGYRLRPALAASTFLAYTLDPGARTTIPAGSQARSVPAQGELPQAFETTDAFEARAEWNTLAVRRTRPPAIDAITVDADLTELTVAGTTANLKPADRLLFLFGSATAPATRIVGEARPDFPAGSTVVTLVAFGPDIGPLAQSLQRLIKAVDEARGAQPPSRAATGAAAVLAELAFDLADAQVESGVNQVPRAEVREAVRGLREETAIARRRARPEVVRWFDEKVGAVIGDSMRVLTLVAAALRTEAPELADVRDQTLARASRGSSPPGPDSAAAALVGLTPMLAALRKPPSRPPAAARYLSSQVPELFAADSDVHPRLLAVADPRLEALYRAWGNAKIAPPVPLSGLQVMRVKARMFLGGLTSPPGPQLLEPGPAGSAILPLDAVYDGIVAGSWVIVEEVDNPDPLIRQVTAVNQQTVPQTVGSRETITTVDVPITVLTLAGDIGALTPELVTVYAQGEPLQVLGDPLRDDIGGGTIELDRAYDGLRPGRWLIVSGERTDVPLTSGVAASELTMIAGVRQRVDPDEPGDTVHATLVLANELAYTYRRDTALLYGNVTAATQGETRTEVLGSGDAGTTDQVFTLRQVTPTTPLTWLPADNPLGADDALTVRVNGVRWHEVETLTWSRHTDHDYVQTSGPDATAAVAFGDGTRGARLPTGQENVTAEYRVGAGRSGNLVSDQISQLASRPLGVSGVTNPLPSTGGADGDQPADSRELIPLRVLALDRLLSTQDYQDFTRARVGIGKASARRLYDGAREVVHVTIAGMDDVPIDPTSALFTALQSALADSGDPHLPVEAAVRDLVLIVLSAGVRVDPDHSWTLVEPAVRAAVLSELGFANRELGEPAYLSRVVAAMQHVPGVDYVDVDVFAGIAGSSTPAELAAVTAALSGAAACVPARPTRFDELRHEITDPLETLTSVAGSHGLSVDDLVRLNPQLDSPVLSVGGRLTVFRGIRPAQLALLSPDVPETLILRSIP